MPYAWMRFSTMTAPALEGKTPTQIRDFARDVAGRSGGQLLDVYFDIGEEVAYALFKDLGRSEDIKRASREMGATGVTKMLDADQADAALK